MPCGGWGAATLKDTFSGYSHSQTLPLLWEPYRPWWTGLEAPVLTATAPPVVATVPCSPVFLWEPVQGDTKQAQMGCVHPTGGGGCSFEGCMKEGVGVPAFGPWAPPGGGICY